MGQYNNDWLQGGRNYRDGEEPEYYEDTHDDSGRYIAPDMRRPAPETGRRVAPEGRRSASEYAEPRPFDAPRGGYEQPRYSDGGAYDRAPKGDYRSEPRGRAYDDADVRPVDNMDRVYSRSPRNADPQPQYTDRSGQKSTYAGPSPLPDKSGYIAPRFYQNVVVYEPRTPEDVQILIDYLKRREPAIINLNNLEDTVIAQRILDFLSGAEYALGGSVHAIADNIFLLTPEGVEITVPYDI